MSAQTSYRWGCWGLSFYSLFSFLSQAHGAGRFEPVAPLLSFQKGNLHTHSLRSDGDSPAEAVVQWYRDHGYQFLSLTDHNRNSPAGEFATLETPDFHVIPGEEVSYTVGKTRGSSWIPVHVNSFCATQTVGGYVGIDTKATLLKAIDEVRRGGGLPQVNHPNFEFALTATHLLAVPGSFLMEVANQHPFVNNDGRGANPDRGEDARPSTEKIWDILLTAGHKVFGTATDDTHDLVGNPGFTPRRPGQGWVEVSAATSDPSDICGALAEGRFYFTTGVELGAIAADGDTLEIRISAKADAAAFEPSAYQTQFIGSGGEVLVTASGSAPGSTLRYRLRGGETYVRAVVSASSGKKAWTQPFYIR